MGVCSTFQDLFRIYSSLSDWIKALWLIVPPAFVLGLAWIVVNRPIRERR